MELQEESLRTQIALGWLIMLMTLIIMLTTMIISSSFAKDGLAALSVDPGQAGISMLMWIFGIYALMPVYVNIVRGVKSNGFRWGAVVIASLMLLYFLLHHTSHWIRGERPGVSSHVLDVVHHVAAVWVIFNSVKWAKLRRTVLAAPVTSAA